MPLLNGKNKSKKPKFLLALRINELINIPQSSGYCYVKWSLKDGTGTSSSIVGSNGESTAVMNQSHGLTPRVLVENHRARWNYEFDKPLPVKLQVDKNRELQAKKLILDIYFEFLNDVNDLPRRSTSSSSENAKHSTTSAYSQRITGKVLLGTVCLNIAEYVREDEQPVTNRFLLKKSKVNSILNVTVQMRLARGTYNDFHVSKSFTSGQLPGAFRSGIGDILDDASDIASPASSVYQSSIMSPQSTRNGNGNGNGNGKVQSTLGGSLTSSGLANNSISASMSPLVDSLYQKTFQLPWDPRPGEFTPRECVEDILQGGNGWAKNEKGVSLIDLQALQLNELESDYYENHKDGPGGVSANTNGSEPQATFTKYDKMDKREFLEKRQNWSHLSYSQRAQRRNGGEDDEQDPGFAEKANSAEDLAADKMREAKSWSVNNIIT